MAAALDNLVVDRHHVHPDGTVELCVRVVGPLPDGADVALAAYGGTADGDDVLVSRSWSPSMVPDDPRAAMRGALTAALTAWAAGDGPIAIAEPGESL